MDYLFRVMILMGIFIVLSYILPIILPILLVLGVIVFIYYKIKTNIVHTNDTQHTYYTSDTSKSDVIDVEYTIKEEDNDLS